jgi:hypothetical protein
MLVNIAVSVVSNNACRQSLQIVEDSEVPDAVNWCLAALLIALVCCCCCVGVAAMLAGICRIVPRCLPAMSGAIVSKRYLQQLAEQHTLTTST